MGLLSDGQQHGGARQQEIETRAVRGALTRVDLEATLSVSSVAGVRERCEPCQGVTVGSSRTADE